MPGAFPVGVRGHHVEAIGGDAGAHDPGQDVGATCLGVLLGLDQQKGAALAEHKAVAVPVEWAACTGGSSLLVDITMRI